ncbi:MAG: anthranilate phosphoribosyltransferase [Verrucomicrobiales bacterium VVV1]|nr:MAG: anthranilate phosphoribosyltransferase [Verrucomicrobiales bacterium VVV1]
MTALPDPSRPLAADAAATAFAAILDGQVADDALAAFLVALAERGETVDEIVAAATVLRQRQNPGPQAPDAIDVCGTGGDGKHSLNISTAVSLVVAACGVKVAKHGNRAASSSSGAADVLAALGVPELPLDRLGPCLDTVGITFLHAARHHPAMARVAPVRRALGRRTIFNLLGPLANPAGVRRQLVGVFAPGWTRPMAEALQALGSTRAMVVHGDGYDELTVTGISHYALAAETISEGELTPERLGLSRHDAAALAGGDAAYNAARLRALLAGETGAYHDIVVLNAAAALTVADPALSLAAAATSARAALAEGAAADTLARWSAFR